MNIFFHIPKCAGTSLELSLNRLYPGSVYFFVTKSNYAEMDPDILRKSYKFLCGHISHDYALPYIEPDSYIFTILRNPLSRIRSLYNYFRGLNSEDYIVSMVQNMSFLEFISSDDYAINEHISNHMIKQFTPESYWKQDGPENDALKIKYALKFLSRFNLIGFVEELDKFSRELDAKFPGIDIHKDNVSTIDLTIDVDDDLCFKILYPKNVLDFLLYNHLWKERL